MLDFLARGIVNSTALGIAVREAMALGDPDRYQLKLWATMKRRAMTLWSGGSEA